MSKPDAVRAAVKRGRRADALTLLGLLALTLLFLSHILAMRETFYQEDFASLNLPYFHWLHAKYSSGEFPGWCQSILCGHPYYDEGISSFFYAPLRLILMFFGAVEGLALFYALHIFWAAAGTYLLARSRGLEPPESLFAAVTAAFSGGVIYAMHGWIVLVSLSWFPWMLLGMGLCQEKGLGIRLGGAGLLGLSLGQSALGGHAGIVAYEGMALAALQAAWLLATPRRKELLLRLPPVLVLSLVTALLLCGGQVAATLRYAAQSVRDQAFSYAQASENSLSPASLLHILLPYAFGGQTDDSFLGANWRFGSWVHQVMPYLGAPALLLAWRGLRAEPRLTWPFVGTALLLLLCAMGSHTPLHGWLHRLPVFDHLRAPMKMASLCGMLMALPAAWGLRALRKNADRAWQPFLWLALLLVTALLLVQLALPFLWAKGQAYIHARVMGPWHPFEPGYYLAKLGRYLVRVRWHLAEQAVWTGLGALVLAWQWKAGADARGLALSLVLFGELWSNGARFHPSVDRRLYEELPPTARLILEREASRGQPFRYLSWGWRHWYMRCFPQGRFEGDLEAEQRLAAILYANQNFFWGLDQFRGYTPVGLKDISALMSVANDFSPGLDLAQQTRALLGRRDILDQAGVKYLVSAVELKVPDLITLQKGPLWIYENARALPLARFEAPSRGTVRFLRYEDALWELEAESPAGGSLFLARAYYQGTWKAEVAGRPVSLERRGAFCGLRLPPGRQHILLRYQNPSLGRAAAAHAAGWLLAAGLLLGAWLLVRRAP